MTILQTLSLSLSPTPRNMLRHMRPLRYPRLLFLHFGGRCSRNSPCHLRRSINTIGLPLSQITAIIFQRRVPADQLRHRNPVTLRQ